MAAPAVQERLVLLGNHVLSREPVAQQRLARITGRRQHGELLALGRHAMHVEPLRPAIR